MVIVGYVSYVSEPFDLTVWREKTQNICLRFDFYGVLLISTRHCEHILLHY